MLNPPEYFEVNLSNKDLPRFLFSCFCFRFLFAAGDEDTFLKLIKFQMTKKLHFNFMSSN